MGLAGMVAILWSQMAVVMVTPSNMVTACLCLADAGARREVVDNLFKNDGENCKLLREESGEEER